MAVLIVMKPTPRSTIFRLTRLNVQTILTDAWTSLNSMNHSATTLYTTIVFILVIVWDSILYRTVEWYERRLMFNVDMIVV